MTRAINERRSIVAVLTCKFFPKALSSVRIVNRKKKKKKIRYTKAVITTKILFRFSEKEVWQEITVEVLTASTSSVILHLKNCSLQVYPIILLYIYILDSCRKFPIGIRALRPFIFLIFNVSKTDDDNLKSVVV